MMAAPEYSPPEGFITMTQVGEALGVSRITVQRLVREGRLKVYTDELNKRVRLVRVADVEALRRGRTGSQE